jgi:hypothetical protein
MKKAVFVLLLVVLLVSLVSLALPGVAKASCDFEDPCNPGWAVSGNGQCFASAPPGLQDKIGVDSAPGSAGDNWTIVP